MFMSRKLGFSGGRLINDQILTPSNHFPWEDFINGDINTPDIDPSFFNDNPFEKMSKQSVNLSSMKENEENEFGIALIDAQKNHDEISKSVSENNHVIRDPDECFVDLSQIITPQPADFNFNPIISIGSNVQQHHDATIYQLVDVPQLVNSSSITIPVITAINGSIIGGSDDCNDTFRSSPVPSTISHPPSIASPSYSSTNYYSPSPASSISNESQDTYDVKPNMTFLQPTVIEDHLYTLPKPQSSNDDNKYLSVRKKNNAASKKSRLSKRDKQKQMEEKIQFYLQDNQRCKELIDRMEKEIQFCKDYLFNKVMQATKKS